MLHDSFVEHIPVAEKIIRTLAVYVLITVLFRLTGKRGFAGLNTFDVVILLLSDVAQNAIVGSDDSLLGGIIGASTLVAANTIVNRVVVLSSRAERLLQGRASIVISDGDLRRDRGHAGPRCSPGVRPRWPRGGCPDPRQRL